MPSSSAANGNKPGASYPRSSRTPCSPPKSSSRWSIGKYRLQAEIVHQNGMLAFMTYDDEHHRIAMRRSRT